MSIVILIVTLLFPVITVASTTQYTWSNSLEAGNTYIWQFTGDSGHNEIINDEPYLVNGSTVEVEILDNPSDYELQNVTCNVPTCDLTHTSTELNSIFDLRINNEKMNSSYLTKTITRYIYPLFHSSQSDSIFEDHTDIVETRDEYIYESQSSQPDNYVNTTIKWDKDSGVMNYYQYKIQGFGSGTEFLFIREGYDESRLDTNIFLSTVTVLSIYAVLRYQKENNR